MVDLAVACRFGSLAREYEGLVGYEEYGAWSASISDPHLSTLPFPGCTRLLGYGDRRSRSWCADSARNIIRPYAAVWCCLQPAYRSGIGTGDCQASFSESVRASKSTCSRGVLARSRNPTVFGSYDQICAATVAGGRLLGCLGSMRFAITPRWGGSTILQAVCVHGAALRSLTWSAQLDGVSSLQRGAAE